MQKKSTVMMILCMSLFILLSVGSAGCASQAPPAPVPDANLSTIDPSQIALQPADLPGNFTLLEKGERARDEMRDWSLDHGWKKGYYTVYQNKDRTSPSRGIIYQYLSIYPPENISLVQQDTLTNSKNWSSGNISVEPLTIPAIGDSRNAFRITDTEDPVPGYFIFFVKKDVYEEFSTNGTMTDYDMLQQVAGIAAAKIR